MSDLLDILTALNEENFDSAAELIKQQLHERTMRDINKRKMAMCGGIFDGVRYENDPTYKMNDVTEQEKEYGEPSDDPLPDFGIEGDDEAGGDIDGSYGYRDTMDD